MGKALIMEVMRVARGAGYKEVKLDTLQHMTTAIGIYKSLGFVECEKYYETPMEDTVFLKKDI